MVPFVPGLSVLGAGTAAVSHKAACSGFRRQGAQAAVKCFLTSVKVGKIFKSSPRASVLSVRFVAACAPRTAYWLG